MNKKQQIDHYLAVEPPVSDELRQILEHEKSAAAASNAARLERAARRGGVRWAMIFGGVGFAVMLALLFVNDGVIEGLGMSLLRDLSLGGQVGCLAS